MPKKSEGTGEEGVNVEVREYIFPHFFLQSVTRKLRLKNRLNSATLADP